MLHLSSGARIDGDEELVFRQVDLDEAGGDGLYAADIAEALEISAERVQVALAALLDQEVVETRAPDPELGPRYVKGRAV